MTTDNASYYTRQFYQHRHEQTQYAAQRVLERVADILPPIRSAVDVGCGVGTWLAVLRARGVQTVHGYDGDWVDTALLEIPADCFESRDLTSLLPAPNTRYDLAISLEVAEHLPESAARTFVQSLINQADFVLFSAAIPHQGGRHHVNEQWLEYWAALFQEFGYSGVDALRPALWHDDGIQTWYRQNAVLFVKQTRLGDLSINCDDTVPSLVSMVHPAAYQQKIARYEERIAHMQSLQGAWKLLRRAMRARLKQ